MKKNRKADDFLNFIKEKQKLDNLIELKKRQNLEKSFTPQDLQKFKYEVFEECGKLLQKMKEWTYEGSSKEDISQIFARLDKKDEDLNRLYEDSKQNYINEVTKSSKSFKK